jgi:chromosome segregation ATPase
MKKNTYSLAYEACEAYFSETGEIPTIEAIKPIININSPTTISNAIKDWKVTLSQGIKSQHKNHEIPLHLISAITEIWEEALTEANKTLSGQLGDLQEKQAELDARERRLNDEASRIKQLVNLTEQKYQEEANYLKKEINRITGEYICLKEKKESYQLAVSENEKNNAVLSEQIRQEHDKYNRLENQYNKEHEWSIKRIEEEKDNIKQQKQAEIDRLKSESAYCKQANKLLQAKLDLMVKQINKNSERIVDLESRLANEKLRQAELVLNEAKLQKELNITEEKIHLLLDKRLRKNKQ